MPYSRETLQIYEVGPTTVIGFGGRDILDDINVAQCRDELIQLIRDHDCRVIAFDLTGVRLLPSGLLGLLASLRNMNLEVCLYNPSPDVREVLAITKFDQLLKIKEVDVTPPSDHNGSSTPPTD